MTSRQSELKVTKPQDHDMIDDVKQLESGRAKYVFVWILSSALMTVITYIPDQLMPFALESIQSHIGLQAAYAIVNGAIGLLSISVLLVVYSCFKKVFIKRAMPYFWGAAILGFLLQAGSSHNAIGQLYFVSGLAYIDFAIQFVGVFLIYWIPETFFPQQYNPPSGRHAFNIDLKHSSTMRITGQAGKNTSIRQEPPLTAQR